MGYISYSKETNTQISDSLYQSYLWESSTIDITHDTNPYKNIINQATRIKI